MSKDVVILTGAGQIGMAIARRVGFGKKIVVGDKSMKNADLIYSIYKRCNLSGSCSNAKYVIQ